MSVKPGSLGGESGVGEELGVGQDAAFRGDRTDEQALTGATSSPRTSRRGLLAALAILALLVLAPLLGLPSWLVFLFTVAFAKGLVVLGVVLLLRGDLVSFGHGLYYAIGAYAAGLALRAGFPLRDAFPLAVLGALAGAVLASIVGLFLARYRGIFFGMLSTAFSMILYSLLLKLYWLTGGTDGIAVRISSTLGLQPPADLIRLTQYYFVLALAVGSVYLAYRVAASPLGYLMRGINDNEIRVEYMGASVRRAIYRTYVLSGALGGLGGALTAITVGHIAPDLAYWTASGEFVFIALLGGSGSVFAPFVGAGVFELVRNYAQKASPYTWQMLLGSVLLVIILFAPGGLWSVFERLVGRRPTGSAGGPEKRPAKERRWALSSKR
ncbi:MAG: branched-chain amino acid ABC transporter permease [Chloroflexi bacterium]|nr:branched-chain amino acid ABC transporter permease [Chloroflexota bacterium]